jgi:lipoyl(octanoyl) transferase
MSVVNRNDNPTPSTTQRSCRIIHAGRVSYQAAWDWQRQLVRDRAAGQCDDTLLLLEHPPTITLGRAANCDHILLAPDELERRGVAVVECDRGGDVTYHAPGQLVGYPILKLRLYGLSPVAYLRQLEEVLICSLAAYNITAERVEGLTGVWVQGQKIAAIGVKFSASGVTSHGFALNVAPDMCGFDQIVPCGLHHHRVTSLAHVLGAAPPMHHVAARVVACFADIFGIPMLSTETHW